MRTFHVIGRYVIMVSNWVCVNFTDLITYSFTRTIYFAGIVYVACNIYTVLFHYTVHELPSARMQEPSPTLSHRLTVKIYRHDRRRSPTSLPCRVTEQLISCSFSRLWSDLSRAAAPISRWWRQHKRNVAGDERHTDGSSHGHGVTEMVSTPPPTSDAVIID